MTIVITMAGEGKRFRAAGYQEPKYQISVRGKTLFEWSMDSLIGFYDPYIQFVFITRKIDNARGFLEGKCERYGIKKYQVVELDDMTDGQATTCMQAISYCDQDDAFLVYNIDTYVEPYEMRTDLIQGDGFIPCFNAEGTHWSFVETDCDGKAVCVKEKERISGNCSVGAYYFKTGRLFEDLYKEYYGGGQNMVSGEKYIAPMYNLMIEKGMEVRIQTLDKDKVHILGTPEELEMFQREEVDERRSDWRFYL